MLLMQTFMITNDQDSVCYIPTWIDSTKPHETENLKAIFTVEAKLEIYGSKYQVKLPKLRVSPNCEFYDSSFRQLAIETHNNIEWVAIPTIQKTIILYPMHNIFESSLFY